MWCKKYAVSCMTGYNSPKWQTPHHTMSGMFNITVLMAPTNRKLKRKGLRERKMRNIGFIFYKPINNR